MKKYLIILGIFLITSLLQADAYQAGDDNLMIMPTAYTMEAGRSYFSDYEIILIDFHYAITSNLGIGCTTIFPVTTHFLETLTIRSRFKYLDLEKFKGAIWAAYIIHPNALILGNVFSIGKKASSFHIGLGTFSALNPDGSSALMGMLGYRIDVSKKHSLFAELIHTSSALDLSEEEDLTGYMCFGLRFRGDTISWEIGGFRPYASDTSELLFFPIIKATVMLK